MYVFVKGPTDEKGAWYQVSEYFNVTVDAENAESSTRQRVIPDTGQTGTVTYYYLQAKVKMDETTERKGLKGINQGYKVTAWGWNTHSSSLQEEPVFGSDAVKENFKPKDIQYVQFRYDAELKSTAAVGGKPGKVNNEHVQDNIDYGNANDAMIYYTEPSATGGIGQTGWDRNRVYTYKLVVNKQDENELPLSGAVFSLFKKYNGYTLKSTDIVENVKWQKRTCNGMTLYGPEGAFPEGSTLVSQNLDAGDHADANAYIYVKSAVNGSETDWIGIDDGDYLLVEANPPFGYKALTTPIPLTITAEHEFEADDPWWNWGKVKVDSANLKYFQANGASNNGEFEFTDAITAVIPNEPYKANVRILKIDESTRGTNPTPLTGAWFKLVRWDGKVPTGAEVNYTSDYNETYGAEAGVKVDDTGTLTFQDIRDGEYKIVEVTMPNGYVRTMDNDIYFRMEKGVVYRHEKPTVVDVTEDSRRIDWGDDIAPADDDGDHAVASITYTRASESTVATFTVGNTPGVALPSTGGRGTGMFYIVGSIMTLLAAVFLITKRRTFDD